MAERLGEIRTPVPFRGLVGVWPEALIRIEQQVLENHQVALIEWKREVIGGRHIAHRLEAEQIRFDRQRVAARQERVGGIGKGRI
jgi:hypothetical protein